VAACVCVFACAFRLPYQTFDVGPRIFLKFRYGNDDFKGSAQISKLTAGSFDAGATGGEHSRLNTAM